MSTVLVEALTSTTAPRVAMRTARTADAPRTDGARPDATPADAGPPYDPCAAAAVIDLNMRGTTMGATTRFTGNNNAARMAMIAMTTSSSISVKARPAE